jgi:hypothetical protein
LIIDRRVLYMLSFNLTYLHVEHGRFRNYHEAKKRVVHGVLKLLAADYS